MGRLDYYIMNNKYPPDIKLKSPAKTYINLVKLSVPTTSCSKRVRLIDIKVQISGQNVSITQTRTKQVPNF